MKLYKCRSRLRVHTTIMQTTPPVKHPPNPYSLCSAKTQNSMRTENFNQKKNKNPSSLIVVLSTCTGVREHRSSESSSNKLWPRSSSSPNTPRLSFHILKENSELAELTWFSSCKKFDLWNNGDRSSRN